METKYFLIDKIADLCTNLFSVAITFMIPVLFLFFIYKRSEEKRKTVNLKNFLYIFKARDLFEKIDKLMLLNNSDKSDNKITDNYIESITEVDVSKNKLKDEEIMKRKSKNYGELKADFSDFSWFGVNYNKLKNYEYICFEIVDCRKFYFKISEFINLITKDVSKDEQKKYIKRNSFDTYINKRKDTQEWEITRLGSNLKKPIKIVLKN